jgi:hypothetical protein
MLELSGLAVSRDIMINEWRAVFGMRISTGETEELGEIPPQ